MLKFTELTPVYLLVVLFNGLILPHIGNGPNWKNIVTDNYGNYCTKNWWTNILYVCNYVNPTEMCMFQSWYIATNFHCSMAAPLIIYPVWRMPRKIGYYFLSLLILLSCIPPFYMSYFHNVEPFLRVFPTVRLLKDVSYFNNYYIKTHMRLTPYLVGLIIGIFIYDYNFSKWRLPKIWSQILIILLGPIMGLGIGILGFTYMDPNVHVTPLETAIYASIHRGAFAFSICSIVVLFTIGDGLDIHYKLLNFRWMQPLSKLTFCVFVMHNVLQSYRIGVTRTANTFSYNNIILSFISNVIWCFVISLIIAIIVEVPFRKMEKQIVFKREHPAIPDREKVTKGIEKID